MKSIFIKTLIFVLFCGFITSCTDVIDVDVPNGGERLVIDASIKWEKGTTGQDQTIILSKSTEYFSDNSFVGVVGALVQVTNNTTGDSFVFNDQADGNYTTSNFIPILNDTYTLTVVYDAETYTGTETLFSVSDITSIEQDVFSGFGEDEIQVRIFFDDPAGIHNYYTAEFISPHIPFRDLTTRDDEFSDGNENFIEFDDEDLVAGDVVTISLHGVSEHYYNYATILENQAGENGPFSSTPVQLTGNCKNLNNPDEEVLGYFRLGEVDTIDYTIN